MVPKQILNRRKYFVGSFLLLIVISIGVIFSPYTQRFYDDALVPLAKNFSIPEVISSIKNSPLAKYVGFSSDSLADSQQLSQPMTAMSQNRPDRTSLQLNLAKQQLLGIQTSNVEYRSLEKLIRTVGRIDYDERKISAISLKVGGWIGKLFVNYTGKFVRKGEPLFTIYSPDLVSTQEEYLLALRTREKIKHSSLEDAVKGAESLVESSRNRLLLWDITADQIIELAMSGKAKTYQTIYSPGTGFVIKNNVVEGMFVKPGMTLFRVADLSTVWIYADIYEYEMPFVKVGQVATITLPYNRRKTFKGRITYIYPYLEPDTRTVKVRLEFPNPDFALKPQMYANAEIKVKGGRKLAVIGGAVLHSGIRNIVFVYKGRDLFEPREVKLGPKVNGYYEVLEGLSSGEKVVTSGNFLLDSESRLMAATGGMKGMMSMIGMGDAPMAGATGGDMGGMEGMEGMEPMKGDMKSMGGMKGMEGMEGMEK